MFKNLSRLDDNASIFRKIGNIKIVEVQNVHVIVEFGRRNKNFWEEIITYFPFTVI
jgi:hypothetical protein